jgi:hypothetical protein
MPYKQEWYIRDHVYITVGWGKLSLEELLQVTAEGAQRVKSSPARLVHTVSDFRHLDSYPQNLRDLYRVFTRPELDTQQQKIGWNVIVVHRNRGLLMGISYVCQLLGIRMRIFNELPEAFAFLDEMADFPPDAERLDVSAWLETARQA